MTQAFSGRTLRARFKSVRALRFLLHTLRLRYFCSGKIHKFCCKIASMQVELTLFVTPSLKVSWLPSEVYVLSGDLSKRALRRKIYLQRDTPVCMRLQKLPCISCISPKR